MIILIRTAITIHMNTISITIHTSTAILKEMLTKLMQKKIHSHKERNHICIIIITTTAMAMATVIATHRIITTITLITIVIMGRIVKMEDIRTTDSAIYHKLYKC